MLLSYCYIFSHPHSPSPTPESDPATRPSPAAQDPSTPAVPPRSGNTLLTSISNWSDDLGSSLKSTVPSSVASLFDSATSQAAKVVDSASKLAQSSLSSVSSTSWFEPSQSEVSKSAPKALETAARPSRSSLQQVSEPTNSATTRGNTTFTFCLFGAASTAAVYLLARNRRAMNRLQSAKSLAYRDARAWRRVALDFAKINALSASRVQSLVAASLRDGHAGAEIGRQIERELEEATRTVAQRRNWIQQQDQKDAQAAAPFSMQRGFGDAWRDVFDPRHTGFSFGARAGRPGSELGNFGRWKPGHHFQDGDVPRETGSGSDASAARSDASTSPVKRSAQQKWQRVAGLSATAAPASQSLSPESQAHPPWTSARGLAEEADAKSQAEAREEWIGDVDRAIRERDLKSSQSASSPDQAAVDAFSRFESEPSIDAETGTAIRDAEGAQSAVDEEDYLLPVSDLHIATNGQIRDATAEVPIKRLAAAAKASKIKNAATKVNTTVNSPDKYAYPISDQFGDLHDIFIAAWDGNLTGLTGSGVAEKESETEATTTKAKPNKALFDQLRAKSARKGIAEPNSTSASADEIEFMAELMFPSATAQAVPAESRPSPPKHETTPPSNANEKELTEQLDRKQAELAGYRYKIDELSERLDAMREMCHDLTDEASRRDKMHKIQIEQLDHKIGLFTVWAEEVQRRLGLETPPFFASLRKPLKRD
ncbi:hypothetical protein PHBOTO_001220 [Pseudozyma hubeiensis]|nr:hypothetical protein PHBOTO_001220 [Pseudozyma hubeiensis]